MRLLIVTVAMAGTLVCAAADQTLTYAAGDTSLGDGVVDFTYDGDSKITKIVSNVAKGDTVTLTGAELAFGTGATIETAGLGDLVLKNVISGTDGILVTNTSSAQLTMEWWGNQLLHNKNWTTVFENVDLDDIEIVSSDEKTYRDRSRAEQNWEIWDPAGPGLSNPQMMHPFWEKRETVDGVKQASMQLQCYVDSAVKYIALELKQDGDNIVARATEGGYFMTNDTITATYLENTVYRDDIVKLRECWLADPDPDVNPKYNNFAVKLPGSTGGGYGVGQLTARRNRTCLPSVTFANAARKPVLGGILKIAANARARRFGAEAFNDTDTELEIDGIWEAGESISAHSTKITGSGGTMAVVSTVLAHENPCDSRMTGFVNSSLRSVDTALYPGAFSLNHSIFDLTNICNAVMCGGSMTYNRGVDGNPLSYNIATPCHWRVYTNGPNSYATVQMQGSNSTKQIRCSILKFQGDPDNSFLLRVSNITNFACATPLGKNMNTARSTETGAGYFGMDFENTPVEFPGFYNRYTANTKGASANASPFSVSNLVCQFSRPGEFQITVNTSNQMQNARLVVEGKHDGTPITAVANWNTRLPLNGEVIVRDGGILSLTYGGTNPADETQNTTAGITVFSGGILRTYGSVQNSSGNKWAIHRNQRIRLLGGEMWPSWMHSPKIAVCYCYLNNTTFADGARVTSDIPFWAGNAPTRESYRWLVRGTSPSYIDSPVQFLGTDTTGLCRFKVDVADVTGDSATDFFMTKPITRYSSTSLTNIRVAKHGQGTMEVQDTIDIINGVEIYGGSFKLASSGITDDSAQKFILSGGTLEAADGTENVCGTLSITARGGKIKLGAGAKLTFADSSAETWAPTEKVVVEGFAEGAIRIGTSLAGAPKIRIFETADGGRLWVGEDGYLTTEGHGMRILIR